MLRGAWELLLADDEGPDPLDDDMRIVRLVAVTECHEGMHLVETTVSLRPDQLAGARVRHRLDP